MSVTSRTPTSASAAHSATISGNGARHLAAARVRDDAERADVVAALHRGDERGGAPARGLGIGLREDVVLRVHPAGLGEPLARGARDHLRELADVVRPEDEVDVRDAREEPVLLLLRHAARHRDERAAPRLHLAVAAERGEELLLRLLAHRAGVEEDEIRVLGAVRARERVAPEQLDHPVGVRGVHLAAEGVDEDLAESRPGGRRARGRAWRERDEVGHAGGN